jgi:tRNA (guanine-N7-)-methyltransferase
VLRPGGCVYTITDVEELGKWMRDRFEAFGKYEGGEGLFERVEIPEEGREGEWEGRSREESRVGMLVRCIREETEEGKKVTRNGGRKFVSVWRRREDPEWPDNV